MRMLQGNTNLSEDLQLEFSIKDLVDQIKPGKDKDLKLSNLNLTFNHVALIGVMKKPTTKHESEKVTITLSLLINICIEIASMDNIIILYSLD